MYQLIQCYYSDFLRCKGTLFFNTRDDFFEFLVFFSVGSYYGWWPIAYGPCVHKAQLAAFWLLLVAAFCKVGVSTSDKAAIGHGPWAIVISYKNAKSRQQYCRLFWFRCADGNYSSLIYPLLSRRGRRRAWNGFRCPSFWHRRCTKAQEIADRSPQIAESTESMRCWNGGGQCRLGLGDS